MELAAVAYSRGDLDATLAQAEALWQRAPEGSQVRIAARFMRTWVDAFRGRLDVALPASAETLADSRRVGDPQSLGSSFLLRAFVLHSAGRSQEAHGLIDELLALNALMKAAYLDALPLLSAELGRESDYLAAAAASTGSGRWFEAGLAVSAGDYERAAEIYSGMGARFVEHWARLLAAERGGKSELESSYAYFAEQEARPFLRRCEALLPASA
jgi:hypothetical protein